LLKPIPVGDNVMNLSFLLFFLIDTFMPHYFHLTY
jgi:hypothetical protein